MGITVLGPLTVDGSGRLGPRDRVVLQALATSQGQFVSADELIDALWGDHSPASAAKNLQSCVVRLRKALGHEAIVTSDHGYALVVPADQVDAWQFEAEVTRARELLTIGEADRVAFLLEQALALWTGRAFPDLPDWPPARREAERLDELRLGAEEMYVDALMRSGRPREVLARGHAMVSAAPLRERRWELLALAQYRTGAQGEALRTIRQLRAVLDNELGIDPSPDMAALERSILRQDADLLVPQPLAVSATCPWQGLKAYDVDDADRFFGRAGDVASCLELLERNSFVALVGPSGSGKSSILRAGALAALRGRGLKVVVITPGRHPMRSFMALFGNEGRTTVLAVDQAEEVFAVCEDPDERRAFLERLAGEATRRPVLVTVRGDRLTQVTEHPGFSRLVERGLHLVGALDEAGLRDAVEGPARQAGLIVEPGLVDLLVHEVRHDPGALPLLSHALVETWQRREGHTLTVEGYLASGGIRGAVAQSAERLYASIGTAQRSRLRDLVLRLVSPGLDGEAVRTRVPRRLIASGADHEQLIELLVDARLVTSDEGVLEVTHEALARAWPRLRGWLEDDVEGQRIRHHLSGAADAWDTLGRPPSELYRGVRLTRALDWQSRTRSALTDTERAFLTVARAADEAEAHSAAERSRAQSRLIRRLRTVLSVAVILLVVALAAGSLAAVQSRRASRSAATALASETQAIARRAGAAALVTSDIDTALLLAVAAVRMDTSSQTLGSLIGVLSKHPALIAATPLPGDDPRSLDLHPDGRHVAVLDTYHRLRVLDLPSGDQVADRQVGARDTEADETRPMRFSPNGDYLAVARTALGQHPVALLDAATLEPATRQPGGLGGGHWQTIDLRFSHDGSRLVSVLRRMVRVDRDWKTRSVTAFVWDVARPSAPVAAMDLTNPQGLASAALSPDGRRLYTLAPELKARDLESGETTVLAEEKHAPWGQLEVSPDGRVLAQSRGDLGETLLRNSKTGAILHRLLLDGEHSGLRFSDDGRRLMTVTWHDRDVAVWDVRTGRQRVRLQLTEGNSGAVDLDAQGHGLLSAAVDGAVREWDLTGERRYLSRLHMPQLPWRDGSGAGCLAVPSVGGLKVAYDLCDETTDGPTVDKLVLLDVATRTVSTMTFRGGEELGASGSWDPDGTRFSQVVGDTLTVWDEHGQRLTSGPVDPATVDTQFMPGGERLLLSGTDGRVSLVDATSLSPVGTPVDLGGSAWAVPGNDDHHAFAVVGGLDESYFWRNPVRSWALIDLAEGKVVRAGKIDVGFPNHIAMSPDGRHAAVAGISGHVQILDVVTGRPVRPAQLAHSGGAGPLSFSRDGRRMVSAGLEGSVALWDVSSATITARVRLPESVLTSAVFRPDDQTILIAPWWSDPAVYVWDPSTARAIDSACRAAGRDLTAQEWREHFGDQPFRQTCPQE